MRNPTIEGSNLNGTDRQVLVQTNLLPQALDLDVLDQRLYWADNIRNGYFLIERSYVNGKGRQLLYRGIGQFVVSLAVRQFLFQKFHRFKRLNRFYLFLDRLGRPPLRLLERLRPEESLVHPQRRIDG